MSAPVLPLRSRLRAIDEGRAGLQTRLVAALNRRLIGDLTTAAGLASDRDRGAATALIRFRAGEHAVEVAPLLIDGAPARLSDAGGLPDAAAAAAALTPLEPLIAALERVLGRELHPVGMRAPDDRDESALTFRLDAGPPGGPVLHRLLLSVPDGIEVDPEGAPPLDPGATAGLRLRWAAWSAGPRVTPFRLRQLGRGDLLVLGIGPLLAQVRLPGRNARVRARVDLQEGNLVLEQDLAPDGGAAAGAPDPQAAADPALDWGELRVATTIEITGATLTAAELATLGRGSVLPIDAPGGALAVRVTAGDRLVAQGELVAVGQGFGVLVTAIAATGGGAEG